VTAATGAYYNVLINLAGLDAEDTDYVRTTGATGAALLQRALDAGQRTQAAVQAKLEADLS
jgi:hypothetical protein